MDPYYHNEDSWDVIGFFYDVCRNMFIDEDGNVVPNMFEFVRPSDIFLFKHCGHHMVFRHRADKGLFIELHHPDDSFG